MRDTFLFDLDGTLLPMNFEKFMELYFYYLGAHFEGKIDPKLFGKSMMEATNNMRLADNNLTNEEKFMQHFDSLIEGDIEEYRKHFDAFYDGTFENVRPSTSESKEIIESIEILKQKGYKLVIATNPLFPLKANHHRIKWAGLDNNDFDYITSFEVNKYTKPHLEFYEEVLNTIEKKAEQCYMIGNDVSDDLPAGKLGIETYLITDCLINSKNLEVITDHQGDYGDFLKFVKNLKPII